MFRDLKNLENSNGSLGGKIMRDWSVWFHWLGGGEVMVKGMSRGANQG